MKHNPHIHRQRSIRLKGYDYSQNGAYFITMCVQNREYLFGYIQNGEMKLNDAGRIIQAEWEKLPQRFFNIVLDTFVVMPNHFHGIIFIQNWASIKDAHTEKNAHTKRDAHAEEDTYAESKSSSTGTPCGCPKNTIGNIIGAFKSLTTNQYIHGVKSGKFPPFAKRIWHRNYYENIIRNEKSLNTIREYMQHNPQKWDDDRFFTP
jgi:REP element-mobilizing transposase RayT